MSDQNKAVVRDWYAALERGDEPDWSTYAPDFVSHDMPAGKDDLETLKSTMSTMLNAFSDWHVDLGDMIAEGDKLAVRFECTAKHTGEFAGIPATGKAVTFGGIEILQFKNGQISEHWERSNSVPVREQVGTTPAD